jgi:sugar phosphate isomerase/epimerase
MSSAAPRERAEPPEEPRVCLSTASVYPEPTSAGFAIASRLGYDAVEVMVGLDETSQDAAAVARVSADLGMPVCAVHAPCLLITQRVWGTDPWGKLHASAEMAAAVGADVVVVHPPFRWQRDYARRFVEGVAELEERTGIDFAVENMYPWRASRREVQAYLPHWDPSGQEYRHTTLDVSHAATSRTDALALAKRLGPRLRHLHLTDGTDSAKDEHLVPGRGSQPVAALLEHLSVSGFGGHVVVEVNTRRAGNTEAREIDLVEALAFARLNLALPAQETS